MKGNIRRMLTLTLTLAATGATASAADFVVNTGDGVCPAGYRLATKAEVDGNTQGACSALGQWYIARLADGGSQDGPGYSCRNRDSDSRTLGHSLCTPSVVFYADPGYGGASVAMAPGYHTIPAPIGNDNISSVRVPAGYRVTLYEHSRSNGKQEVLTADASSLSGFDNITSNVLIERL